MMVTFTPVSKTDHVRAAILFSDILNLVLLRDQTEMLMGS
jgi:hypothetical protein